MDGNAAKLLKTNANTYEITQQLINHSTINLLHVTYSKSLSIKLVSISK